MFTVRCIHAVIKPVLFTLLSFLLLLLVACGQPEPEELRIGVIAYLSGPSAGSSGKATVNAVELAAKQINETGGLVIGDKTYHVTMVIKDGETTEIGSLAAAQALINQENVVAIIGPQFSRDAIAVAQIAERSGVPMISPMSTSPATTLDNRFAFRVAFTDPFQGPIISEFARQDLQAGTAAVLYDVSDRYSRELAQIFKREFEVLGGTVVAFESYTSDEEDVFTQLTTIRDSNPDILFLPNFSTAVSAQVEQARWMGIEATILGSDSWNPWDLVNTPELDGAYLSQHWHPDIANEKAEAFITAYTDEYGETPSNTAALTYDATQLLFVALQHEGDVTTTAVRDGLYNLDAYSGVSGVIDYQANGDPVRSVVFLHFVDGTVEFYKSVTP